MSLVSRCFSQKTKKTWWLGVQKFKHLHERCTWEFPSNSFHLKTFSHMCHGQKSRFFGDGHPTFNRNPYNGYINPYYWVDDHPLLYGNNGSLDPGTYIVAVTLNDLVTNVLQDKCAPGTWRIIPVKVVIRATPFTSRRVRPFGNLPLPNP